MKEGDTHELFNMLMYQHIRRQELIFLQAGEKNGMAGTAAGAATAMMLSALCLRSRERRKGL